MKNIAQLIEFIASKKNGRKEERFSVVAQATLIPLSADKTPSGDSRPAVVRDISMNGIGLLTLYPLDSKCGRIQLGEEFDCLTIDFEVAHCVQLENFYCAGGVIIGSYDVQH